MDLGNSLQTAEVIIGTLEFMVAVLSVYVTWSTAKSRPHSFRYAFLAGTR